MKRSLRSILEMTATAAGPGTATFTPGQGEQTASNFGFKKKRKKLSEEVSYTPQKREEIYKKAQDEFDKNKSDVERYLNIFKSFSIDELLENDAKAKKIISAGEAMESKFDKISGDLESSGYSYEDEDDQQKYNEYMELRNKYESLRDSCYTLHDTLNDIVDLVEKNKDKLK